MPRKKFSTATLTTSTTDASSPLLEPSPLIPATFTDGLPLPRLLVFDLDYTLWPFWVDTHVRPPLKPAMKQDSSKPNTAMIDSTGESFTFYREVPGILYAARQKGISMGLASRTHTPDLAGIMLKNIVIPPPSSPGPRTPDDGQHPNGAKKEDEGQNQPPLRAWDFFKYREIYPGSKTTHFQRIHTASKKKESSSPDAAPTANVAISTDEKKSKDIVSVQSQIAYDDMIFFDDESRNRDVERKYGVTFVLVRDGVTTDEVDRGVRAWRKKKGATNGGGDGGTTTTTTTTVGDSSSPEPELDDYDYY